ncbi:magnesium transporter [Malaciobacter molluscorum LMG 25693]|uniref:Magnesium and cobalt transport protein n=1 Tax=Malaciobacter molluscorum LMG 25693 TaxID=870501 RepID=A0A2G1DIR7_9BACT|nr:CorA family divalent cation transporter [Malaciobacter molluscorum]AXX91936.1 magnesium and cobalt transport protein [Malaciobacter molluscorum LMG 25693]PHO18340.1 magnesium transporter [Malaciobacter molluscorum LMG 25693]RXJ94223.1 magnesium transporter [Malaciobacter molluscorum]
MLDIKISNFHLKDIKNELHPSTFIINDEYDLLIMRLPLKQEETFYADNSSFIFTNDSYFYFDKDKKEFIDIKSIKQVYNILNKKIDESLCLSLEIFSKIEEMEDKFYENIEIKGFNKKWFTLKNQLIRMNRVLSKTIEQLKRFILNYKKEEDFLEINFHDLLEHLERAQRNSTHSLEKLDALYNFHTTNSNEKMNKTIYVLTLLSGIFLPLNLVVGFFGMNTSGLPLTKIENGTFFVLIILLLSAAITTILINRVKNKS